MTEVVRLAAQAFIARDGDLAPYAGHSNPAESSLVNGWTWRPGHWAVAACLFCNKDILIRARDRSAIESVTHEHMLKIRRHVVICAERYLTDGSVTT